LRQESAVKDVNLFGDDDPFKNTPGFDDEEKPFPDTKKDHRINLRLGANMDQSVDLKLSIDRMLTMKDNFTVGITRNNFN